MSPNITLRSLTEHCPSSRYNNNFGIKNIGSISHLMNFDNINSTTLWGGNLRVFILYSFKYFFLLFFNYCSIFNLLFKNTIFFIL